MSDPARDSEMGTDPSLTPPALGAARRDAADASDLAAGCDTSTTGEGRLPPPAFVPTDGRLRRTLRTPVPRDRPGGLPADAIWGVDGEAGQGPGPSARERRLRLARTLEGLAGDLRAARSLESPENAAEEEGREASRELTAADRRDRAVLRGVIEGLLQGDDVQAG